MRFRASLQFAVNTLVGVMVLLTPASVHASALDRGFSLRCFLDPLLFWLETPAKCLDIPTDIEPGIVEDSSRNEAETTEVQKEVIREVVREVPVYNNSSTPAVTTQTIVKETLVGGGITASQLQSAISGVKSEILSVLPASSVRYVYSSAPTYHVNPGLASEDYVNERISEAVAGIGSGGSASSSWLMNGSALYYSSGNIGIGTSTPAVALSIAGTGAVAQFGDASGSAFIRLNAATASQAGISIVKDGISRWNVRASSDPENGTSTGSDFQIARYSDGGSLLTVPFHIDRSTGNTTIGTGVAAGSRLGVFGNFSIGATYYDQSAPTNGAIFEGNVGIGTTTVNAKLVVDSGNSLNLADFAGARTANQAVVTIQHVGPASSLNRASLALQTRSTSAVTTAAQIYASLDEITHGSRTGRIEFLVPNSGSLGTARLVIVGNRVGIGTTSPVSMLSVAGSIHSSDLLGGATTLSTDANGNIIRTPSDSKLKADVQDIGGALDKVSRLRGVSYSWIDQERFGKDREIGFLAQELELVVPEVVKSGGEYKSVNYQSLVALLAEAIKELKGRVDGFATQFKTKQLCVGETCVTEDEFKSMLQNRSSQTVTVPPLAPVSNTDTLSPATSTDQGTTTPSGSVSASESEPAIESSDDVIELLPGSHIEGRSSAEDPVE